MTTLLLFSAVLVVLFVSIAIWRKRSLPESISALVYVFRWKWLWTVWMWAVSVLTCIPSIELLSGFGMEFLGFGTMACLCFCGAVPLFLKDNVIMHWVCGVSGCILSQICVYFIEAQWLGLWMPCLFLIGAGYVQPTGWLGKATKGKWVFLAESTCYVALMGAELMYYLS
jgi:hypothetical protein